MPFTPFHFGIGLAAKAVLSRHFYVSLFIALQVITDLESLYNLVYQRNPVHRFLHTFVGATLLAVLSSALVFGIVRLWRSRTGRRPQAGPQLFALLLATALFATWSHVVLDGIMHHDVKPFWPLADVNPFLRIVRVGSLHLACLVLGFFGGIALLFQWSLRERDD